MGSPATPGIADFPSPDSPSRLTRPGVVAALAVGGTLLWVASGVTWWAAFASGAPVEMALLPFALGLVCHVAAVAGDVARARSVGRWPILAVGYASAVVALLGYGGVLWAERQARLATPDGFEMTYAPDGLKALDPRDAAGPWRIPYSACPGVAQASGSEWTIHDGVANVTFEGAERPQMRLHVAERRVECLDQGSATRPAPE